MEQNEIIKEIREKAPSSQKNSLLKYLSDIGRFENLTREEEIQLAKEKDAGSEIAREKLIQHNLRWVVSIARNIWVKGGCRSDLQDLISQGNMGLITAVDRYNYKENTRLSTYATSWIMLEIHKYLSEFKSLVANPEHVVYKFKTVAGLSKNLEKILMRPARAEEISEATNQRLTTSEVEQLIVLMQNSATSVSLDRTIAGKDYEDEDSSVTISESLVAPEPTPEEKCVKDKIREDITRILDSNLKPIEAAILKEKYIFAPEGKLRTFDELSEVLFHQGFATRNGGKLKKQYLQVAEARALEKLREVKDLREIKDLLVKGGR